MHLEKIEILGFKSFADKTILRFDDPITAIVGPNGCGKSNIVDAFRWVLGEGSAKSLRSDKMVDVIFGGAASRKPLNYAQISLTFTGIDQALSLNYTELCITRRIHRNGESEWMVNRNPVRLKDVHKILWEAGIGKNAFYIFEQGKVDDLVVSSPLERRIIFEEAAKIMHFKEKKKESLRKLSQVEGNLKRVLDIQSEVNQQIETLQKQAEEARIYAENKERLQELEKGLMIYKWRHNHKKHAAELESSMANKAEQQALVQTLKDLAEKLQKIKSEHAEKAQQTKKSYESFFEVKKGKELASYEYLAHKKNLETLQSQKEQLKRTLSELHQKHLKEHQVFEENQKSLKTYKSDVDSLSTHLTEINQNLSSLEKKVEEESQLRRATQQQLMLVVNSANELQTAYKNNSIKLHTQKESLAALVAQEKNCQEKLEKKREEIEALQRAAIENTFDISSEEKAIAAIEAEIEALTLELETEREKAQSLLNVLTEKKAKVDFLKGLKDQHEGFNSASKKLLAFAQKEGHPLFGKITPLKDWFEPLKGYEAHLSTLLQPYLQTLVVATREDLELVQKEAKEAKLENFSLWCQEDATDSTHLKVEFAKENPVSLHFLGATQSSDQNRVDGEYFLDTLKVYHKISKEEQSLFLRERELKESMEGVEQAQAGYNQVKECLSSKEPKIQELKVSLKEKRALKHENELKKSREEYSLNALSEEIQELAARRSQIQENIETLQKSIHALEIEQKEAIEKCEAETQRQKEEENRFSKIESEFESNFNALKEKRGLKQSLEDRIKEAEKKSQHLSESIRVFESKSSSFEDQIKEMNEKIVSLDEEYQKLQKQNHAFETKEKAFQENLSTEEKKYQAFEDALESLEKEEKALENELVVQREILDEKRSNEVTLQGRLSEIQTEISLLSEEIQEKLELSLDELEDIEIDASITLGKTEKEIRSLRRTLESQPEVNLKAISECEKQQERFSFLQSQIDDLNLSQEKLLEIITSLDDKSREMFKTTFEKIRERFRENFSLLFNGGESDLKLTDHPDILEAGVDIIAQPPGKKMRSIQLMSGGEKCLCAIALLFALFETQSIPFCILDEIDAPLDDTNIERFTRVLKQFVKNNQFIIITHNKRTMAIADNLLGVSMQEKGVTKIIPLEFNAKVAPETANA